MTSAADEIRTSYEEFCSWSGSRHGVGLSLLVSIALSRFFSFVLSGEILFDERIFVRAFEQVASGNSPYLAKPFNYPAPFALVGAKWVDAWGLYPVLVTLRFLNLIGLAVTLWWSVAFFKGSWWNRVSLAAVFIILAPPIAFALRIGNLQFIVTALLLSSLLLWPSRPLGSSVLLAMSCLIKPIGVLAGVALFSHKSDRETRNHLIAAIAAGAIVLGLLLATPYLGDFWQTAREPDRAALTLSVHRLFHSFGARVDPRFFVVAVIALATLWARSRKRSPWALLPIAIAASLAATPILWSHSLILTLPVQVMAFTAAMARREGADRVAWEVPMVVLAAASLTLSGPLTRVGQLHEFWQLLLAFPVIAAPFALAFYLDRVTGAHSVSSARWG